ncbi:MAG: Ig-like domain-containing protein [Bacteroidaceae bacterium]|nr:Ig-like domain-containing protein [Bacteroidaceae bacterium]
MNGEEVKDLVIPNTVTSIKDYAFYECSGLTSVTIGNSVESIGYRAFTQCSGLTSVTIGKSVTSIEDFAFEDCSGLTSVTIPNSVTSIGWGAFSNCPELLDVYCYAEKVPSTVSYAFDGYYIQNATLHVPAASIDSYKATEPWSSFGKIESIETTIPVSSITLSQSSATMTEGETLNLTATVTPDDTTDKSITWSSSNTSVASVDADGKVTAQTEGTATITATANDGSGVKASCVVTVEKKIVSVSSITLSQSSATMTEGETLALTATVTPDDATDKSITWSSSNTSVASVDANGKVTAKAEGIATITATANNGKEYADKLITIGTAQAEMVPSQWYFLHSSRNPNQSATDFAEVGGTPASAGGFVTDMGLGTGVKLTATSVIDEVTNPEGVNANNYMASIVRFVEVEGEEGAYNIQFGTGNWVGHHDGGNGTNIGSVNHNNYIAGNAGKYNFYLVTIDGTPNAAGRFGWNKFNMADRVDNNGADGTVVFWGDGEITGESEGYTTDDEIKGNKIWQIYDIVVVGEVDKYADALKASCVVTVEKKIVSVASITLSQSSATMTEGETLNLTATITPYDATDKSITWSSSNEEVASVDANGNVTAKAEGTATITATANDGSGVKASCVVTVNKTILGKCATPIISYADGQVSVTCETEDAKVVTAVANVDDGTYEEIEFSLTPTYTITAYATKAQYENSDVATLTICWIACTEKHEDEEETGLINIPAKAVLIQSHQGIITLSGLDAGTEVAAYNTTGAQLATAVATDGTATLYTNLSTGSIVIVKFGNKSVKIKI